MLIITKKGIKIDEPYFNEKQICSKLSKSNLNTPFSYKAELLKLLASNKGKGPTEFGKEILRTISEKFDQQDSNVIDLTTLTLKDNTYPPKTISSTCVSNKRGKPGSTNHRHKTSCHKGYWGCYWCYWEGYWKLKSIWIKKYSKINLMLIDA